MSDSKSLSSRKLANRAVKDALRATKVAFILHLLSWILGFIMLQLEVPQAAVFFLWMVSLAALVLANVVLILTLWLAKKMFVFKYIRRKITRPIRAMRDRWTAFLDWQTRCGF